METSPEAAHGGGHAMLSGIMRTWEQPGELGKSSENGTVSVRRWKLTAALGRFRASGERLQAGEHLLQQRAGGFGHAEVGAPRPRLDLGLGQVGPADHLLEQVEVEAREQRDDVEPLGERPGVGQVAMYTVRVRRPAGSRSALASPSRTSRLGSWYRTLSGLGQR
jgi:hypothetical protein